MLESLGQANLKSCCECGGRLRCTSHLAHHWCGKHAPGLQARAGAAVPLQQQRAGRIWALQAH